MKRYQTKQKKHGRVYFRTFDEQTRILSNAMKGQHENRNSVKTVRHRMRLRTGNCALSASVAYISVSLLFLSRYLSIYQFIYLFIYLPLPLLYITKQEQRVNKRERAGEKQPAPKAPDPLSTAHKPTQSANEMRD